MKKILILLFSVIIILSACSEQKDKDHDKPIVYTTSYGIDLLVESIAENNVDVQNVYPPGVDSHSYEFTTKELKTISNSDLIFYISNDEDKAIYNLSKQDTDNTKYVNLSKSKEFVNAYGSELKNPHIWLTPKTDLILEKPITNSLIALDPDHKKDYQNNEDNLKSSLNEFDKEYEAFGEEQTKELIVLHDAFYYYNKDYGIDYISLYGPEGEDEPSSGEVKDDIDLINKENIPVIYKDQNSENIAILKQIQGATGTKIEVLNDMDSAATDSKFDDMTLVDILNYNLNMLKQSQK